MFTIVSSPSCSSSLFLPSESNSNLFSFDNKGSLESEVSSNSHLDHGISLHDLNQVKRKLNFDSKNLKEISSNIRPSIPTTVKQNPNLDQNQIDRRKTFKLKTLASSSTIAINDNKENIKRQDIPQPQIIKTNQTLLEQKQQMLRQDTKRLAENKPNGIEKLQNIQKFAYRLNHIRRIPSPVRLLVKTSEGKRAYLKFQCFNEDDLGVPQHLRNVLIPTDHDDDIETDDETLEYYIKKVRKQLWDAVSEERKKRNKDQNQHINK